MEGIYWLSTVPQQKVRAYIWESLLLFMFFLSNIYYPISVPDVQLKSLA